VERLGDPVLVRRAHGGTLPEIADQDQAIGVTVVVGRVRAGVVEDREVGRLDVMEQRVDMRGALVSVAGRLDFERRGGRLGRARDRCACADQDSAKQPTETTHKPARDHERETHAKTKQQPATARQEEHVAKQPQEDEALDHDCMIQPRPDRTL